MAVISNIPQTGLQPSENFSRINENINSINTQLEGHVENVNNPHSVTPSQIGLGNVNNTSDMNKPVSTAQQQAINNAISSLETSLTQTINDEIETVTNTVTSHIDNTSNPHSVTASQVGAPTTSQFNSLYTRVDVAEGSISNLNRTAIKNIGSQSISGDLTLVKAGNYTGNLVVQGNLTVQGTTTTESYQTLAVQDNMIITNDGGSTLTDLSGLGIKVNSSDAYGIVYDPVTNSVNLGLGSIDSNNEFSFDASEGLPVAVRAVDTNLTNGHLLQWNSSTRSLVDGGAKPTKLPNPFVLFAGSVTYDGSSTQTITADTIGALTKTQADGYYQPKGSYLTSIPQASTGSLGGIKVGYTTSGKNYAVNVDTSGNAYVNVPWTDTNTTYGVATSSTLGLVKGGTTSGKVYGVSIDGNGAMTVSVPWTDNNTVTNIGANNANYTSGNINFVGSGATSVSKSGSTVTISSTNTTYSKFSRSSNGLVPNPGGSTTTRYLREDGTWQVPPDTNTDTKVTQTHSTGNANYPILLKNGTGTGNVTSTTLFDANVYVNPSTGTLTASKVYGAVFNDYAEYRKCVTQISPGYIVTEEGNDYVTLCRTKKNKGKLFVVTDTYGTCIGEKINSVPVALTGRVLVYYDYHKDIKVGDYVGCNDCGEARKMSKLEAFLHPERVLGTVSAIPDYDVWGTDNVKVDGRIWVNIV